MSYQTQMPLIFVMFFQTEGNVFDLPKHKDSKIKKIRTRLDKQQNSIQNLSTDRHFLFLSDSYLYMVHLGLGPFSLELAKIVGT